MKTSILLVALAMAVSPLRTFSEESVSSDSCSGAQVSAVSLFPKSIDSGLEGLLLPADYGRMVNCREWVSDALATVTPQSIGYDEKRGVEKLLNAKVYPVTPADMVGSWRVRSIQIDVRDGIFSYPYFRSCFRNVDGTVFFEKTTGSQRKSGYVYQNGPESLAFLGGWSVNDDPQTFYGGENSVVGTLYKIGRNRAIMLFPISSDRVEIYELVK